MAVTIRPVQATDIPTITSIYADAVTHSTATYELGPPDESEMSNRIDSLKDSGFPYFVAVDDSSQVLGYAYISPFRTRPAYRFFVENSVYISSDAKGKGIGRMLMERLIQECGALGFRQIVAVIGDGGAESASVKFHEKLGFRHVGKLEGSGFKFGRWLDTVLMQLSVNGGTATLPEDTR
ncbi:hypothetical protein OQA88_7395 [Cercophora sp. LCS_1]